MAYADFLVDKRIVERNIRKGLVSRKEYERFLAQLPDSVASAEPMGSESDGSWAAGEG